METQVTWDFEPDFQIKNKFGTDCDVCGREVPEKEGLSSKGPNDNWFTVCMTRKCIEARNLTIPGEEKRTLEYDGEKAWIDMPYDEDALPLLRSLPGARWNPDDSVWEVSSDPKDRPRILDIADRLELDVDEEFEEFDNDNTVERHIEKSEEKGLYDYQLDGVRFLMEREAALLGDDMGVGKTVQVIMSIPEDARTLVTCPNTAKYVWADEVEKWRPELDVTIPAMDERRPPEEGEIVVVNYSRLPGDIQDDWSTDDIPEQGVDLDEGWKEIDVLVGDECHAFKNREAQRTRRFRELRKHADKTWGLTGTPLSNRPFDLWGTLSSLGLAFDVYGSFSKFLDLFNGRRGRYGIEFRGSPDREASERLRRCMLRRMKEDVLSELPTKTRQDVRVRLGGEIKDQMDEITDELDLDDMDLDDLKRMDDLPGFEDFSEFRAKLADAKYAAAIDIIEEYEEAEEPLVVFSDHRGPVESLGQREGWKCIHGGTDDEKRGEIVNEFQNGDLMGIALTIGAGKEGLTLTEASDMLFIDLSWIPGDNAQAEDRIRRIGQEDACHYKRLVSDHPLDEHIMELLDKKLDQIAEGVEKEIEYEPSEEDNVEIINEDEEDWKERVEEHQEEKKKKAVSQEERETVTEAMKVMLERCDGARSEDGIGFNQHDAGRARRIMRKLPGNDGAVRYCKKMLQKYSGQIGNRFPEIFE